MASDAPLTESDFSADDGFVIIHTAAVGGRPRGALLSQTGLLTAQSSLVQAWQLTEHDVNLGVLPLFHVAGLGLMLTVQQAGGASVIAAKFDPAQAVRDIAAEKVTVMSEFAPMLANLMDRANGDELATLRAVTGLDTPETIARFEAACPNAMFWATFGQSETSGIATLSPYRDRPKSAGRPLFWRTIAVVDTTDTPRPTGQTGEIVVRGPTVFKGYWNNKLDTDFTFRNGWHHTGDMGYFDADGYLWYAGHGGGDHRVGRPAVADVNLDGDRIAADCFHRIEGFVAVVDVGHNHSCADVRAGSRIFPTDAARSTCHDHHLAVQIHSILPKLLSELLVRSHENGLLR